MASSSDKGKEYLRRKCKSRDSKAKISLEDYLRFLHSQNYADLCINFLNQIISMHGYKKIHKCPKVVLAKAVSTLALVNPCRSTLRERISPASAATIEDVVEDLEELSWHECTVTSIQTLNSATTSSLAIYTSQETMKCHAGRSASKCPIRRKALVPIKNGGPVQKVRRPTKAAKRLEQIAAAMNGYCAMAKV